MIVAMDPDTVIEQTRRWIAHVVIGLNLCPFARRVFDGELIRYTVTATADAESLRVVLGGELRALNIAPADFRDYNDFVANADDLIEDMGLRGVIQIAGFHPRYQFSGTRPDDVENYTNRSPFPMLHLLREDSISRVNDDPEKVADIPRRNIETLGGLGLAKVLAMLRRNTASPAPE
jgi:hypothetical protein